MPNPLGWIAARSALPMSIDNSQQNIEDREVIREAGEMMMLEWERAPGLVHDLARVALTPSWLQVPLWWCAASRSQRGIRAG